MITREALYDLVWSMPMTKVAAQFKVSGSYMARVCSVLKVPRPERGYWAKLAVGRAPKQPPLPPPLPGDPETWSLTGTLPTPPKPRPRPAVIPRPPTPAPVRQRQITGTHPLIQGAKAHCLNSRPVDDDGYLRPYKKLLVDLHASRSGLDKALAFGNDLFNALESAGHRVVMAAFDSGFSRRRLSEKEATPNLPDRKLPRQANTSKVELLTC
ncbi:hypothetical protein [Pseudomarimonas arenosa]|uniref:Uncharacterized protein n=1 Tax=Pseudomarimonas arenosa TaxID=2774145 RepID=A0AAW3ZH48_9GAMM|nr:hypothetical protein [Pseudomarimonas arenosa]MBD8524442.1 hypothetical protein [Pseudomarimonas arenosa]